MGSGWRGGVHGVGRWFGVGGMGCRVGNVVLRAGLKGYGKGCACNFLKTLCCLDYSQI